MVHCLYYSRVSLVSRLQKRYWLLYPAWIVVCAILFFALRPLGDPARPPGLIGPAKAEELALQILRDDQGSEYASYQVINAAFAGEREIGPPARWIVLLDSPSSSALRQAVVVELDAASGELIRIREPWQNKKS